MNDAQRQTELYTKIWAEDPHYGTRPVDVTDTVEHRIVPHMERVLARPREAYVVDFGAGDGRFLQELYTQGALRAGAGVDLHKPLDKTDWLDWQQVPMWEADFGPQEIDFVISTDSLEHLPPEKVDETLAVIAKTAKHGFLRISLQEDRYGTERGLHLHESVFSAGEWLNRLVVAGIRPMSARAYFKQPGAFEEATLEVWY